jgi:hypothetical protein
LAAKNFIFIAIVIYCTSITFNIVQTLLILFSVVSGDQVIIGVVTTAQFEFIFKFQPIFNLHYV